MDQIQLLLCNTRDKNSPDFVEFLNLVTDFIQISHQLELAQRSDGTSMEKTSLTATISPSINAIILRNEQILRKSEPQSDEYITNEAKIATLIKNKEERITYLTDVRNLIANSIIVSTYLARFQHSENYLKLLNYRLINKSFY